MQIVKRTATLFSIAAFVPLLVLGSLYVASLLQQKNQANEEKALERVSGYMGQVDGKLSSDLRALTLLSDSKFFVAGDWMQARNYAETFASAFSNWRNIVLVNGADGQPLWETIAPSDNSSLKALEVLTVAKSKQSPEGFDALIAKRECDCVIMQRNFNINNSPYLLLVVRDVKDIQQGLMSVVLPGEIAAVVDRNGSFIARTIDSKARMGTPATQYVQDAVAKGGSGVYSGTTFEGLRNRTAYASSKLSGWSTHIAVPALSYSTLSKGSLTFAFLGIFSAFGFAAFAIWYAINDLANRRRSEQARMRSQKLEALGYLSGAVAHDFNNLLAVMTTCLRFLGSPIEKAKKEKVIQEGLAAAGRGEKLVKQLLTFARDKPMELECVDLEITIIAIQDLVARCLGPGIFLETSIMPRVKFVHTNASQLEIGLLNLAVNARDAMPDGGTFSISTKRSTEVGFVDLMIKDSGVGMSKDVAARALEPFFTTKEEGKGTGLGLAQVQRLVKESSGTLLLETEPDKGTVFILRLPSCKPSLRAPEPRAKLR